MFFYYIIAALHWNRAVFGGHITRTVHLLSRISQRQSHGIFQEYGASGRTFFYIITELRLVI